MDENFPIILIRGGGDLASGIAIRLHRAGLNILITETFQPLAVRRLVSFAEAVYQGSFVVEDVKAQLVNDPNQVNDVIGRREIPLMIDPDCKKILAPNSPVPAPLVLVDARMTKRSPELGINTAPLVIGLGPGFIPKKNCHAAIETNRGHFLGRVLWNGKPEDDTGIPGAVARYQHERVLRAPTDGILKTKIEIGERVYKNQLIAVIGDQKILAPIDGILRGLLHDGIVVQEGLKIGDVDPRNEPNFAKMVSEKSLAIAGGALEALLTIPDVRNRLWS